VQRRDEWCGGRLAAEARDELRDLLELEAAKWDTLAGGLARQLAEQRGQRMPATHLGLAVQAHDHQSTRIELAREEARQSQGRIVGPVQVVERQHQRLSRAGAHEEAAHALEQAKARLLVVVQDAKGRDVADQLAELRHQLAELGGARPEIAGERGPIGGPGVLAQHLRPGPEGRRPAALVTAPEERQRAARARFARELLGGAGLADPRLADQQHQPPLAREGRVERQRQPLARGVPSDEGRLARCRRVRGLAPPRCSTLRGSLRNVGSEAVAAAVDRLDDRAAAAVVADRPPDRRDAAGQDRLRHRCAAPDGIEQLALGGDPLAVAHQVQQDVEGLVLELDRRAVSPELIQLLVELAAAKGVDHCVEHITTLGATRGRHAAHPKAALRGCAVHGTARAGRGRPAGRRPGRWRWPGW
jgi:hypothetical protein